MVQLRLRGQRSGQGHRVNRRQRTIPSPVPSCVPSCINSTQASGLVPLSTASQGRVMAPAALPKPLIIPAGGCRVLGLGFGGHPGGNVGSALLWVKLPGGPWAGRGQEVGGWAAGGCGAGQSALPDTSLPGSFPLLRAATTCIPEPTSLPLIRGESQPGDPALDSGHSPHREETEAQGQEERLTPVAEAELRELGLQEPCPGPLLLWQNTGISGLFLPQGNLADPGIEPASLVPPALQADTLPLCYPGSPRKILPSERVTS